MATDDFFRSRLDAMIDRRHALAVLSARMPWTDIEASLAPVFQHKDRAGKLQEGADLFGPTAELVGAGVSARGRRRLHERLGALRLGAEAAKELGDRHAALELDWVEGHGVRSVVKRTQVTGGKAHQVSLAEAGC